MPYQKTQTKPADIPRLKIALFLLRSGVFLVLLMWSLDKLLNGARVKDFYPDWGLSITTMLGWSELLLAFALLFGIYKTYSYGLVILLHGISTLLPFQHYLHPFEAKINLLYFTSWPMLAACITIFVLRREDTVCTYQHLNTMFQHTNKRTGGFAMANNNRIDITFISICFVGGCLGGLCNSLFVWICGASGINNVLGMTIAPQLTPQWLYLRIVWAGIWGLLFYLPILATLTPYRKAAVFMFLPALVQLLIVFPVKLHKGLFGLQLGGMTPVLILLANAVWAFSTAWWITRCQNQSTRAQTTPIVH